MKLTHVVDPSRLSHNADDRSRVHFQRPGTRETMCGHLLDRSVQGVTYQQYHPCVLPVSCRKCRMQLEVGMRERLFLLTTEQLEDMLELTNGHLWPDLEDVR